MMSDVTFVCCIEAGRLENQTVMMTESLRRFGGGLSHCPILAVMARTGPSLSRETLDRLHAIGVEVVRHIRSDIGYEWFGYSNKVKAIELAQARAGTDQAIWLDSDILITGDLSGLVLNTGCDVAVRIEPLISTVNKENDDGAAYWQELCKVLEAKYDDVPWMESNGVMQLACFNSGVIVWRRSSGFAQSYVQGFSALLQSRIAQCNGSFFAADQVIIGPVIAKHGLTWRHLSSSDHRIAFPALLETDEGGWIDAKVLHYSGSLGGEYRPRFLERLGKELPRVADWLTRQHYSQEPMPVRRRAMSAALKIYRNTKWKAYTRSVRRIC